MIRNKDIYSEYDLEPSFEVKINNAPHEISVFDTRRIEQGSICNTVIAFCKHGGGTEKIVLRRLSDESLTGRDAHILQQHFQYQAGYYRKFGSGPNPTTAALIGGDTFTLNGKRWMALKHMGRPLSDPAVAAQLSTNPDVKFKVVSTLARAIDVQHQEQSSHLDLKPGNVVVDESHTAYPIDPGYWGEDGTFISTVNLWPKTFSRKYGTDNYITPQDLTLVDLHSFVDILLFLETGKSFWYGEHPGLEERFISIMRLNRRKIARQLSKIIPRSHPLRYFFYQAFLSGHDGEIGISASEIASAYKLWAHEG